MNKLRHLLLTNLIPPYHCFIEHSFSVHWINSKQRENYVIRYTLYALNTLYLCVPKWGTKKKQNQKKKHTHIKIKSHHVRLLVTILNVRAIWMTFTFSRYVRMCVYVSYVHTYATMCTRQQNTKERKRKKKRQGKKKDPAVRSDLLDEIE